MMYLNQSILRLSQTYRKYLEKCLGWITDSVLSHTINFSKYNLLAGTSYIKLPKELNYIRKGFINIQNINDNECFKWSLVRYLHPTDHNLKRIRKVGKLYGNKLDFKDIKVPVRVRNIHETERKNSIGISVFGYEDMKKYSIYVSKKCCEDKNGDLLLIGEE